MKIKNFVKRSVVLLALVSVIPSIAVAKAGRGFRNDGPPRGLQGFHSFEVWRNPQLVKDLDLSETQTQKLRDLSFSQREKQMELRNQLESLRLEMRKEMTEKTLDEKTILSLAEQISELQGKLYVQGVEGLLAASKVLTDDQLSKLKSYRFEHRRPGFHPDRRRPDGRFGNIRN